jgi:hypothetical protein
MREERFESRPSHRIFRWCFHDFSHSFKPNISDHCTAHPSASFKLITLSSCQSVYLWYEVYFSILALERRKPRNGYRKHAMSTGRVGPTALESCTETIHCSIVCGQTCALYGHRLACFLHRIIHLLECQAVSRRGSEVHMALEGDNVALGQVFLWVLQSPHASVISGRQRRPTSGGGMKELRHTRTPLGGRQGNK